ncbi:hypothetical protein PHLCEN_2v8947 [Hermanssonia centrifuga]|uniref:Uncharacterized protein n=1 Tax=Hermanssonia centrifuga TaxID=98765 RepID=A0A2R6NS42_9APHY|nr:hypothetical protein PHLCEN_2v8947 [Hermanssonia centrifuga]
MSRFMLNLQDVSSPSSMNTAQLSGLEFAISSHSSRMVGNLGQPLAHFVEPETNVDDTSGYVLHCRIPSSPRLSSVIGHFEELF